MYNLSLFFSFSSRMFEPTFSLFRHFVYLDLSRNLVPRSSHSLRLSRHFEYISILVGNFHVILLCARVFSRAAAILKSEKTLGTRLVRSRNIECTGLARVWSAVFPLVPVLHSSSSKMVELNVLAAAFLLVFAAVFSVLAFLVYKLRILHRYIYKVRTF